MPLSQETEGVRRVSISLLPDIFESLDRLVSERGFQSRSQAISEMVCQSVTEHGVQVGSDLLAGTITLFYDESRPGLLQTLADIQRQHISEVISSQHVLLENNHTMEVLLVQGPADGLRSIFDQLITCKGVRSGRLTVSPIILPPIHSTSDS